MATATFIDEPPGWAPGARHYKTSDGKHFIIDAHTDTAAEQVGELLTILGSSLRGTKQIVRPTVVIECNPDGTPVDLTPEYTFPPGTTHEEALNTAGYTT